MRGPKLSVGLKAVAVSEASVIESAQVVQFLSNFLAAHQESFGGHQVEVRCVKTSVDYVAPLLGDD